MVEMHNYPKRSNQSVCLAIATPRFHHRARPPKEIPFSIHLLLYIGLYGGIKLASTAEVLNIIAIEGDSAQHCLVSLNSM